MLSMAFSSPYSVYPILLFLLPVLVVAQTSQNITLGSSLTAALNQNSSWKSPSGDFAFGFQQIEAGRFLLAIWFDKIPEKTIIWSANGGNLVQQGSQIQLTTDGQFRLSDSKGKEAWVAPLEGSGIVSYAAMLDTGNFVLASQNSNLWESFNHPTDTILPTQILNLDSKLVARYAEMNYSGGRFTFVMQTTGDFAAYTTRFPLGSLNTKYWESSTVDGGFQVIFNQSGYIYVEAKNGSILNYIASSGYSSKDYYQRAILEYDGVFRYYVYPKNSSVTAGRPISWTFKSHVPRNICTSIEYYEGSGACGYNSMCIIGNDQRPKCLCPPGYSHLDPDNVMNGCKQDFVPQECDGGQDADLFEFRDIMNASWPDSQYEYFNATTEDWCRQSCLTDCYCAFALFKNGECWRLSNPLLNGRIDPGSGGKSLIKKRKGNSTSTSTTKSSSRGSSSGSQQHNSTLILILTLLFSSSAFFNLVLFITMRFVLGSRYRKRRMLQPSRATHDMMSLQSFTYKELEEAIKNFQEVLGKGASSTFYKGVLDTVNKNLIAVKRLHNHKLEEDHNEKEFQAEMSAIGKTNHKNLVRLLGFCNEGQHRLLVYEYMKNGSLASYLFRNPRPSWYQRIEIAFGTARGLVYLHEECSNQIIHCDIKPENILLDDSLTARISDFGLAKLLMSDQTPILTEVKGTRGYVAPECWIENRPVIVTDKVDIYSFGILLLELICCRRKFEQDLEDEERRILDVWAYDCYEDGKLYLLVQDDKEAMEDIKRVEKFVMIAIWCIQGNPSLRPTMKEVSHMLEGATEVPLPPISPHSSF